MSKRKQARGKIAEVMQALSGVATSHGFSTDKMVPLFELQRVTLPGAVVGADGTSHVACRIAVVFEPIQNSEFKPDAIEVGKWNRRLAQLGLTPRTQAVEQQPAAHEVQLATAQVAAEPPPISPSVARSKATCELTVIRAGETATS